MNCDDFYEDVYNNIDIEDDRKITLAVNLKCWTRKPKKEEFAGMVPFFKKMTITFTRLEEYIVYGCTIRPAILEEGKTKSQYFVGQQCFFVDVDGTHTVQKSLDICRELDMKPNLIYPTFNFKPSNPRHRIVFIAPNVIYDADLRDRVQNKLIDIFHSDPNSRDRVRQFAGGKIILWPDERARLDIDKLLELDVEKGGEKHAA